MVNYEFIHTKRPVKLHLNVDILDITGHGISKKTDIENKPFTDQSKEKFNNKSISTRTNIKRNKKKEIVDKNFIERSSPKRLKHNNFEKHDVDFYKNTNTLDRQNISPAAENSKNIAPKKQHFTEILENQCKMKDLFENKYDNHKTEILSLLDKEKLYKTLPLNTFRLIIIQEMIKIAAKLYTNNALKPYEGELLKFIRNYQNEEFTDGKGNIKNTRDYMYNELQGFISRVNWVKKWIKKENKTDLLFPNEYFNKKRTHSPEVGFAFTGTKYKTYLNRLSRREKERNNRKLIIKKG